MMRGGSRKIIIILALLTISTNLLILSTTDNMAARVTEKTQSDTIGYLEIVGEANFTETVNQYNWPGTGTSDNPYIIENYVSIKSIVIVEVEFFITIRNNVFDSDFPVGLDLIECKNIEIINNTFLSYETGLFSTTITNSKLVVRENRFSDNNYGMEISATDHVYRRDIISKHSDSSGYVDLLVTGNEFISISKTCVLLIQITDAKIIFNKFLSSKATTGISLLYSERISIKDNIMVNNYFDIFGEGEVHYLHTFVNNTINGNPLVYVLNQSNYHLSAGTGQTIILNCYDLVIDGLDFTNEISPIFIGFSKMIQITQNEFKKPRMSSEEWFSAIGQLISLLNSQDILISSNTISSSLNDGIRLRDCQNVTVQDNHIIQNQENGISLYECYEVIIQDNNISFNQLNGAYLLGCGGVTIHSNNITSNLENGILLEYSESIITISYNFIADNAHAGIASDSNDSLEFTQNEFYNNIWGDFSQLYRLFGFRGTLASLGIITLILKLREKRVKRKYLEKNYNNI